MTVGVSYSLTDLAVRKLGEPVTGAVSTDGVTWSYGQPPPSWVTDLRAPSGDPPLVVIDFKNTLFWVQGVTSGLSAPYVANTDYGNFDPASVVPGVGLTNHAGEGVAYPCLPPEIGDLLLPFFTAIIHGNTGALTSYNAIGIETGYLPSYVDGTGLDAPQIGGSSLYSYSVALGSDGAPPVNPPSIGEIILGYTATEHFVSASWYGSPVSAIANFSTPSLQNVIGIDGPAGHPPDSTPDDSIEKIAFYIPQPDSDLPLLTLPQWVEDLRAPSGDLPVMAADFKNGRYWFNGALCAVGDILEENTDWGNWNAAADIAPGVGINVDNAAPVVTAPVFALLSNGYTCVHIAQWVDSSNLIEVAWVEFTYDSYWSLVLSNQTDLKSTAFAQNFANPVQDIIAKDLNTTVPGANKYAGTLIPTRVAGSVNGLATFAADVLPTVSPALAHIAIYNGGSGPITESVVLYQPQPEADLPAMSVVPSYTTGAVSFDGATWAVNPALVATDNSYFSASWWQKAVYDANPHGYGRPLFMSDPDGNYWDVAGYIYPSGSFGPPDTIFLMTMNGLDNTMSSNFVQQNTPASVAEDDVWLNFIVSFDGAGLISKLYVNDVDVSNQTTGVHGPFTNGANGLPFWVGNDDSPAADGFIGSIAELWIAPGQSLLDGSGDIPLATRRKFISATGKPVNLGADGSTPTGTAPAIFLRRAPAAAASTFATNLGTGGNFAITGTLTNAPTSPSD